MKIYSVTEKMRRALGLAIAFWLVSVPMPVQGQGFFSIQGSEIVDGSGQPVLLRGIGLGGWLVPEGYMLHIPGYGSPTSIHNRIVDLVGAEAAAEFEKAYRENYINERDIQKIAEWGFNSIRLPFHYQLVSPKDQPGVFLETGFAVLDSMVAWCKRYGLYLILDMHCAPGGQNHLNISDSDGEARLWTEPANQDRTVEIWQKIAQRYADEPQIIGYDLLNEPVLPAGYTNLDLRNLYRRLAQAIREVDTNHILFLEGNQFATDFRDLTPPILYGQNIAYSFHKYWSETAKSTISAYLNLRSNWNAALWMGESGENSNPWFHETVKMLEAENVSWCWWTSKKIATTTSPLSAPITPGYQKILDYWNGKAPKPDPAKARQWLLEQAAALALDRCEPRPGVLRSLFDPDFGTTPKPFAEHAIPGVVPAAEYDFGTQDVAYHDNDYMRTRWDVWQPWNIGGAFRNDGVDLEASRDPGGQPYSVGWIEDGEWIEYTIEVQTAGIYEVSLRTASAGSGGVVKLRLDGEDWITGIQIPSTGDWYGWQDVTAGTDTLYSGTHRLRVVFVRGGFNFEQMNFELKQTVADTGSSGEIPESPELSAAFPNPFRDTTRFELALPTGSNAEVRIFDVRGRRIATLYSGAFDGGRRRLAWDGLDDRGRRVAAGVYFIEMKAGAQRLRRKILLLR